jgi:hypothetical protein
MKMKKQESTEQQGKTFMSRCNYNDGHAPEQSAVETKHIRKYVRKRKTLTIGPDECLEPNEAEGYSLQSNL